MNGLHIWGKECQGTESLKMHTDHLVHHREEPIRGRRRNGKHKEITVLRKTCNGNAPRQTHKSYCNQTKPCQQWLRNTHTGLICLAEHFATDCSIIAWMSVFRICHLFSRCLKKKNMQWGRGTPLSNDN